MMKLIAACATVLGLVLGFVERRYAPKVLVTEDSHDCPPWLAWLGWSLAAVGALAYIGVDVMAR